MSVASFGLDGKSSPVAVELTCSRWMAKRCAGFAPCRCGIMSEPRDSTVTLVETIVTQ